MQRQNTEICNQLRAGSEQLKNLVAMMLGIPDVHLHICANISTSSDWSKVH